MEDIIRSIQLFPSSHNFKLWSLTQKPFVQPKTTLLPGLCLALGTQICSGSDWFAPSLNHLVRELLIPSDSSGTKVYGPFTLE